MAPDSEDRPLWSQLTPDLKRKIAGHIPANDAAANLRLVDSDSAAALRGLYDTITLQRTASDEGTNCAQQPWPGHAFVAHWGRPEPWRALTLPQRWRLLCLAASSCHAASLDAALAHAGCSLTPEVLTAAAAAGNTAGCQRLLAADVGLSGSREAASAAGAGGHIAVLQLLLNTAIGSSLRFFFVSAAARGACSGGQAAMLAWLRREHDCRTSGLAEAAARAGQVQLLEQVLLPELLPGYAPGGGGAAAAAADWEDEPPPDVGAAVDADAEKQRWLRLQLLQAITHGSPVEVLRRHYARLWPWRQQQPQGAPPHGAFAEAEAARDRALGQLLCAAAGTNTPCWAAKLEFLLSAWGPVVTGELLRGERGEYGGVWECAHRRPDFLARLRHLAAAGMPLRAAAVQWAAEGGHADALAYLWDEAGLPPPPHDDDDGGGGGGGGSSSFIDCHVLGRGGAPGHLGVLRLLRSRGFVFTARHVAAEARCSTDAALVWLAEVAEDGEEGARWWGEAWAGAACRGAGLAVLRALRARGAAVSLAALAAGGSEEALEWAAAELEAEGGYGALQVLTVQQARNAASNIAATAWLRRRGLLQPE
ncbi:hypothetical protein HXX76_010495 [Chlamydomonas incerta]|uniref:Ankyrin repeat domain-containing protein n=1 Tax=Chlamydomonas incerta TaxID=51695 RepID=A0A835VUG8_CHLIN|nr:hypothetical protein HXX76_010495 [Chlamydomonas incerta]|eukprot:KAG2428350.1 hypothetical protein HXX76_010495 [Chlamydomonas incerta]